MPLSPEFWSVELDVPVDLVPAAEDLLADTGIAVSSYEVVKPGVAMSPDWRVQVLFDAPPDEFWSAYGPLAPGWRERRPIYQLFPALVHLRLFGAGYAAMVERLLAAAGA